MRILHLLPGLMTGGQETMLINIANEQIKEHEVFVVIINKDYDEKLLSLFDKRIKIIFIDRPRSSKNPWYFVKLNINIQKVHPDVVHSHYEKIVLYLIPFRFKFVYTIHGFTISPKYLRMNRNLVAISKGIQMDVKNRAGAEPVVIYNGIKIENVRKRFSVQQYSKDTPFRIVQVSRLFHDIKGQDILIKAVSLLKAKGYDNIHVDFIGEGDSLDFLRGLVSEYQLENISFLGNKPVNYINTHLCEYDLFVQASRYEGFGLSVAEAISAKIPVIISNCDGLLEVIAYGKYSSVFENGSAEDCAIKIESVLNTRKDVLQKIVDEAYNYVEENFDIKKTAENYIKYYKECE